MDSCRELVIGILGGMGTYATINIFKQYAEIFEAEKEWERPRIIIDNRCTMPSRVRAFLYEENVERLLLEMEDSINKLIEMGSTKIILGCNTAHLFLGKIYERNPSIKEYIVNIVDICSKKISEDNVKSVGLLASEGTIEARVYQNLLEKANISVEVPGKDEYGLIRQCIEAVKKNVYDEEVNECFLQLINRYDSCILGCTELPILYEKYADYVECINVYDPLKMAIVDIKENRK